MIDLKHAAKNPEIYQRELKKRFLDPSIVQKSVDMLAALNSVKQEIDNLRTQKNKFNKHVVALSGADKLAAIETMRESAQQLKSLEKKRRELEKSLEDLVYQIPNLSWSDIPIGPDEDSNVETRRFLNKPEFDFPFKHYYELPLFLRDYKSKEGVAAAGTRGYYITGKLALLQRALYRWVEDTLLEHGFTYIIPPVMVKDQVMYGTGFFPSSKNDFYTVNPEEDDLYLIGSSEPSLMFLYHNQKLDLDKPHLLMANTTCFRRESGSYGKDTQGGIRVHQFEKVEMVALCKPEESGAIFTKLTDIFASILTDLGIYGRYLEVSTGDISIKNHRQIDIEAWFPAQDKFREVCSSSNCTDYQTRNLTITYQQDDGTYALAHSLNCTGVTNRTMFAILEQFQKADGSVVIPEILRSYTGFDTLT